MPSTTLYQIRFRQWGWARMWVTPDWCLAIMSDWGNYAYWWPPDPYDFREFLLRCDSGYLARKLSAGKQELDTEATERWIKEQICRLRRERRWNRQLARDEWELARCDFESESDRQWWYQHTKLDDAWEAFQYRTPMQLQMFLRHCWPLLMIEVRRDMGRPLREQAVKWFRKVA